MYYTNHVKIFRPLFFVRFNGDWQMLTVLGWVLGVVHTNIPVPVSVTYTMKLIIM